MRKMANSTESIGTSLWLQNLVHGLGGITIKVKHTKPDTVWKAVFDQCHSGVVIKPASRQKRKLAFLLW